MFPKSFSWRRLRMMKLNTVFAAGEMQVCRKIPAPFMFAAMQSSPSRTKL